MATVLNRRTDKIPAGAVYVGRPGPWGNPFLIGRDGTREVVVAKYRRWLERQPELVEAAKKELAGKDLVCFCAPAVCHGDVLLEVANDAYRPAQALRGEAHPPARPTPR